MTQYQLLGGTSPTLSVVVLAFPSVISLTPTWPTSPQLPGASLSVPFTFKNAGGPGNVTFTLKNGATTIGTATIAVFEGTTLTQSGSIGFTMPAADASLSLTSNYGGSVSAIIQALIRVSTSLTLSLPASVIVNGPVSATGKLSRADAGTTGIGAQTINVYNTATGITVATVSTDASGNFTASFTAPSIGGTYSYAASYGGSGLLSASLSNVAGFTLEGAVDYGLLPWIILGGIALVVFTSSKKKR